MSRIKVSDLEGVELDYWVAMCLDKHIHDSGTSGQFVLVGRDGEWISFAPSIEWSDCGPLIDRFSIRLIPPEVSLEFEPCWGAYPKLCGIKARPQLGPTSQIAICRAVVATNKGEEFEA